MKHAEWKVLRVMHANIVSLRTAALIIGRLERGGVRVWRDDGVSNSGAKFVRLAVYQQEWDRAYKLA